MADARRARGRRRRRRRGRGGGGDEDGGVGQRDQPWAGPRGPVRARARSCARARRWWCWDDGRARTGRGADAYAQLAALDDPAVVVALVDGAQVDDARGRARGRGPARPSLWGMPALVKDNIAVAGIPTGAACPAYATAPATDVGCGRRPVGGRGRGRAGHHEHGPVRHRPGRYPFAVRHPAQSGRARNGSPADRAPAPPSRSPAASCRSRSAPTRPAPGRVPAACTNTVGLKPTRGLVEHARRRARGSRARLHLGARAHGRGRVPRARGDRRVRRSRPLVAPGRGQPRARSQLRRGRLGSQRRDRGRVRGHGRPRVPRHADRGERARARARRRKSTSAPRSPRARSSTVHGSRPGTRPSARSSRRTPTPSDPVVARVVAAGPRGDGRRGLRRARRPRAAPACGGTRSSRPSTC